MDDRTGDLYPDKQAALDAGVPEEHVVELRGTREAIEAISRKVKAFMPPQTPRVPRKHLRPGGGRR